MVKQGEITALLERVSAGDKSAESELLPRVYGELRRMAGGYLRRERSDHTLQATALVHEAYLKLTGQTHIHWNGRAHFFAVAAQLMRRILVDHARQFRAAKRGAGAAKLELDAALMVGESQHNLIADLDEALERLAKFAPRQAQVVEMRFFGGMTEDEIALRLEVSPRTVKRDWTLARAWLHGEMAS
jgi:RNA polymerase sigma factor (TIGR02999 family)